MQEHEGLDGVESVVHWGWCQNQLPNIPPSDLATEDSPVLVSFDFLTWVSWLLPEDVLQPSQVLPDALISLQL